MRVIQTVEVAIGLRHCIREKDIVEWRMDCINVLKSVKAGKSGPSSFKRNMVAMIHFWSNLTN